LSPVALDDAVLISETYGPGSSLLSVEPGSYEVVWKDGRRHQGLQTHWARPIHHEGHLYASSGRNTGDAELRAVEHRTGEVRWRAVPAEPPRTLFYAVPKRGVTGCSLPRDIGR
jgi:hypothetical protein